MSEDEQSYNGRVRWLGGSVVSELIIIILSFY
jgi:hypothetical protein